MALFMTKMPVNVVRGWPAVRPMSSHGSNYSKVVFDFPSAANRIRMMSIGSATHGSFWMVSGVIQLFGMAQVGNGISAVPSNISEGLVFWSMSSPVWSFAGLSLSGVFMLMTNILANSTVGRVEVQETQLLVKSFDYFGNIDQFGRKYKYWSAQEGASVASVNNSTDMITFLPAGDSFGTFYRVIDTKKGNVADKSELIAALGRCSQPISESATRPKSKPRFGPRDHFGQKNVKRGE
jgi:hypothetical protein